MRTDTKAYVPYAIEVSEPCRRPESVVQKDLLLVQYFIVQLQNDFQAGQSSRSVMSAMGANTLSLSYILLHTMAMLRDSCLLRNMF